MAITPFDPLGQVASRDDFDQLVRQFFGGRNSPVTAGAFSPALDVQEDEDAFTMSVELPGVSSEDVDITVEDAVAKPRRVAIEA